MNEMEFLIKAVEDGLKTKVFSIRELGDEQPSKYIVNLIYLASFRDVASLKATYYDILVEFPIIEAVSKGRMKFPTPFVFLFNGRVNFMIQQYIDGIHKENITEEDAFAIVDSLSLMHSNKSERSENKILPLLFAFKKMAANKLPTSFEDKLVEKYSHLVDDLPNCLCHNFIEPNHILFTEEGAVLIDLKTAGANIGLFDLACLFNQYEFSPDLIKSCLSRYALKPSGSGILYQDMIDLMRLADAFEYYRSSAYYEVYKKPKYLEMAKKAKKRFLDGFEIWLQE